MFPLRGLFIITSLYQIILSSLNSIYFINSLDILLPILTFYRNSQHFNAMWRELDVILSCLTFGVSFHLIIINLCLNKCNKRSVSQTCVPDLVSVICVTPICFMKCENCSTFFSNLFNKEIWIFDLNFSEMFQICFPEIWQFGWNLTIWLKFDPKLFFF